MTAPTILPVILSGGSGTRLWPLSRPQRPKQFLGLGDDLSLLQRTVQRAQGEGFAPAVVIANDDHRFLVAEQLRAMGAEGATVVLEPLGRNTAPAVCAAALIAHGAAAGIDAGAGDDPLVLLMPSDHVVAKPDAFRAAVAKAADAAAAGHIVTFGITPDRPHTGYGYIKRGAALAGADGAFAVERFVEKPDAATAEGYLAEGGFDWNAGIFLFRASDMLDEIGRFAPEMRRTVTEAVSCGHGDLDFFRLDPAAFAAAPAGAVDTVVMERTERAAVVPVDMGWTDAGSWPTLWEVGAADADGNVATGPVYLHGVSGSYIHSDGVPLGVAGVEDMIVVATEDGILVAPQHRAQDVRDLAKLVEDGAAEQPFSHATVHRPWGSYKTLKLGDGFQVKQIVVRPGGRLSLQYHNRRAEHWIVVAGSARVQKGDAVFDLHANESTYIPVGVQHRLENAGDGPLRLIEVQSGEYVGEDDIVRLEDVYGRT
jgi:mannose-1-phosphate guanylyltransferase/mannose-6-phosphate isomerase